MSHLFSPLALGPIKLPNRIVVSPMCQYSADDGSATDWHLQHLMQLAIVAAPAWWWWRRRRWSASGRISHGCLGLYSDANEAALARVLDPARRVAAPGTRFAHPARPCRTQGLLPAALGGRQAARRPTRGRRGRRWRPRPSPSTDGWHVPAGARRQGPGARHGAFRQAAERARAARLRRHRAARRARLSAARSSSRRSPTSATTPTAAALENRMRFPLEVARAVRAVVPRSDGARRAHHRHRLGRRRARRRRCGGVRRRAQGGRPRLCLRVGRRRGAATSRSRWGRATRCRLPPR